MTKTQPQHQTYASTAQLAPLLAAAEATTKPPAAALTEQTPALLRSIPQNRNPQKPKPPLRFCPMCQTLLRAVASSPASLKCKKCGYKAALDHAPLLEARLHKRPNEIAVIDKEEANLHTHPIVQATCERCGKTESETWTIAVGSEGRVSAWVFLKCTHCGFIRREAG
jgi:DNA-directed RNA polymerase subunit M/transcription elongation factor TFIIS